MKYGGGCVPGERAEWPREAAVKQIKQAGVIYRFSVQQIIAELRGGYDSLLFCTAMVSIIKSHFGQIWSDLRL